jgi:hypothetical protein
MTEMCGHVGGPQHPVGIVGPFHQAGDFLLPECPSPCTPGTIPKEATQHTIGKAWLISV